MFYDDLVIGSGLTALSVVMGLDESKRVLVLGGRQSTTLIYYPKNGNIPFLNLASGGLGNFWHGVIPLFDNVYFQNYQKDRKVNFLRKFYTKIIFSDSELKNGIFVPYFPIRPRKHFKKILAKNRNLEYFNTEADKFQVIGNKIVVDSGGRKFFCKRLWIAAGTLCTARLLECSGFQSLTNKHLSDHFIIYLGQIRKNELSCDKIIKIKQNKYGYSFIPFLRNDSILVTARPAFFDYKKLDYGISQRQVFGLPTGSMITKLLKTSSPGLICESIFNKTGQLSNANLYNIYAQVNVKNSFTRTNKTFELKQNTEVIKNQLINISHSIITPDFVPTQLSENFFPAIHLHGSVDKDNAIEKLNINNSDSNIYIVDPSIAADLGPEHHIFKFMQNAYQMSKNSN